MATTDVLSKDEVNSLLENDTKSDVYNFTEPLISQIERGQMFRILETLFIDELTKSLTKFLHIPLQVKEAGLEVSRFDKCVAQIKNKPRSYHAIKWLPDKENMLISISQTLLYQSIELLFGGNPSNTEVLVKDLSDIELNVANKIAIEINKALCKSLESVAHKEAIIEISSHHPLRIPLCGSSERVLAIKYVTFIRETEAEFMLCIPAKLFDVKTQKDTEAENRRDPEHAAWQQKLKKVILDCPISLSTVLVETTVKFREIHQLQVGQVIAIPTPKEGTLFVEDIPLFTGQCCTKEEQNVFKLNKRLID